MKGAQPAPHWQVFPDAEALAAHAAARILAAGRAAIAARGMFQLVLSGGRTPLATYARLAQSVADWPRWQVYFGDERCATVGDPERNDTQARTVWLERVALPPANLHAIPAELGPERAAVQYAATLAGVDEFDLVLLGLGEDGHVASLFPGRQLGAADGPAALAVTDAPKPPAERVTLSAARLSRAREVLFLVTGAGKRDALAAWRAGRELPARHIAARGAVEVLIDAAAGGDAF